MWIRRRKGTILVLPGGGYARHAPHEAEPVARWLRRLGWDARVVRYPVATRHPGPIDFVRAEVAAERDRGVRRLGVLGFSAGGHLAGHVALTDDVDFAILGYPVVSMVTPTHEGSRHNLLGAEADDALRRSVSLELLVTEKAPAFFIWATGEDAAVPVAEHAYPFAAALAAHGVPHDLHVFDRGRHGLGFAPGAAAAAWRKLCAAWLRERA